ncbi:hypothetical protein [Pseudomaricurvus sp.]|uniref:hypothetical protein n=1 Tax=Pseudomaricurvus sp. TaxID=2004510 RepID=UPI003F6D4C90
MNALTRVQKMHNSQRGGFPRLSPGALSTGLFIATLYCALPAQADMVEADQNNDLFVPENLNYYNPLKHSKGHAQKKRYSSRSVGLNNTQLEKSAEDIRNNEMSAQHRALNHQWLEQEHNGDDPTMGGKVLSELVKMGFRTYWDGVRDKHYSDTKIIPNSNGDGKVSEEVEYKLRLSDDKVKLTFEYEF